MPNQEEQPRYTDPGHPYSGSGNRYQNRYSREGEYHRGDGPFQFPWWAIIIGFVVWWPLGFIFIALNRAMRSGKLGGFEQTARQKTRSMEKDFTPVYTRSETEKPVYTQQETKAEARETARQKRKTTRQKKRSANRSSGSGLVTGLAIAGVALVVCGLLALPDAMLWLPEALSEGGSYWAWLLEESIPVLMMLTGGIGCLFGAHTVRTNRRMRKKIDNIVGDAQYMSISDIAAAIPCSYEKCCKHLENCIDDGVFGQDAYLDMRRRYLVVKGKAPDPQPAPTPAAPAPEKDQYQKILDELRRVNDAIPDEEMSDKISRLEAVSAKIFEQAKSDPDKLPRMRKFLDYYLPTSLKLLQTYAELEAQGVEGENITESKRRIEQTMDTLVHAFETQLDQLFQEDALDVSADIDVMENMLRADGLAGDTPFKL